MDFDIFGRNVTDKVGNQTMLYMPSQVTCASALPGRTEKRENHTFTQLTVLYTQCTCALSFWKKKVVICDVFDSV